MTDTLPAPVAEITERTGTSRRSFLKWSAVAAGTAGLVAATQNLGMPTTATAAEADGMAGADKTVWSSCTVNCGSRCPLRLQVKDGTVVRVLTDNTGDDQLGSQQVRACVRGRAVRQRIYNPDRLKKPMKRKEGTKRGDGEWEEISWDQALTEIAEKMKNIKDEYGNEAFYIQYGTGTLGAIMACSWPPQVSPVARMLNCYGGYLDHYGTYSSSLIAQGYRYFYGEGTGGNTYDDVANSKLQVFFGNNPLEVRMSGGGQTFVTQQTKRENGIKTIVIDPRQSETAVALGDEWIPLRAGTDAALVAGLIHVILSENLQDQEFLDKYCVGFDEDHMPEGAPKNASYRSYIEGKGEDGIEKTPEWAAKITGVPAGTIVDLAREIATAKPCAIYQGLGPQRHAQGENGARAIMLLACVTGNVGISGGNPGTPEGSQSLPLTNVFGTTTTNPSNKIISVFTWFDAIMRGPEMDTFNSGVCEKPEPGVVNNKIPVDEDGNATNTKLEVPIKALFQYASNSLVNQTGDNNRSIEILQDENLCELIVTCDVHYTVTARYSDYLLPGTTTSEESDIHPGSNSGPMAYGIVSEAAIEPMYECKPAFDIFGELAAKLGKDVADKYYDGKSREDWLRATIDAARETEPDLPTYDEWREMGIFRKNKGPKIPLEDFREDPEANPLPTPSGKIEVYSSRLQAMSEKWVFDAFRPARKGDVITPLPEYVETWEGQEEARTSDEFPLQLIGHHFKARTHSSYGNVAWLKEAHHQTVWINPLDAEQRGIKNDDDVYVYNERGTVKIPARVTPRIAPGVASLPQGAWYEPDDSVAHPDGANTDYPVDIGGSINTLTSLHPSPIAKGNPVHTTTAEIVKA